MSAAARVPKFRALAIGFYGAPNVGDEVLLDVLVHRVHELGGELVVASIDPGMTRRMHAVESIEFANIGAVGRTLLHCDVLIMGGGGIFQDHHPFNLDALYLPYLNDISGYARPMLLARQLGVPVVVWGHGVGPLRQSEPRALVPIASANPQFPTDRLDKRPNDCHSKSFGSRWIKSFGQHRATIGDR